MGEERFVKISKNLKEKRPYKECPNCNEVEYTEYKKKKIERGETLKNEFIFLLVVLSLGLLTPLLNFTETTEVSETYKKCSECYYKEVKYND